MPGRRFLPAAHVRRERGNVRGRWNQRIDGRARARLRRKEFRGRQAASQELTGPPVPRAPRSCTSPLRCRASARWPPKPSGRACWDCCSAPRSTRFPSSWPFFSLGLGIGSGYRGIALPNQLASPRDGLGLVPMPGCPRDRLDRLQSGRIAPLLARQPFDLVRASGSTSSSISRARFGLCCLRRSSGARASPWRFAAAGIGEEQDAAGI